MSAGILKYFRQARSPIEEAGPSSLQTPPGIVELLYINIIIIKAKIAYLTVEQESDCDEDVDEAGPTTKRPRHEPESDDIASYIDKSISSATKYSLLTGHFKPEADYKFPKGNKGRTFQYQWLSRFDWLRYSKQANGGFCPPCCLFAKSGYQDSSPGILVSRPLTKFCTALESLRKLLKKVITRKQLPKQKSFSRWLQINNLVFNNN